MNPAASSSDKFVTSTAQLTSSVFDDKFARDWKSPPNAPVRPSVIKSNVDAVGCIKATNSKYTTWPSKTDLIR